MNNTQHQDYLGDGVYVEFDGYQIILKANDHLNPTDTIALEPSVFLALIQYARKLPNWEQLI